jgi:hypothetical protein
MSSVRFCPFCREAFESAESCPEHGLRLVEFRDLPKPSREVVVTTRLSMWELGYGRGLVLLGALLSLGAFALPLAELHGGVIARSTLYALACGRAKTLWLVPMIACAQLLMLARRRSIADLLAVRLSIVWLALLQCGVVAFTLVGVYEAAALMNDRAHEPVTVSIGLGTLAIFVATLASLWGGMRLGRAPSQRPTRVETVE